MTKDQAVEILEHVANWADQLHKGLQEVERHMKAAGFAGQYQDQFDAIVERLKLLDAKADEARATLCNQGGSNA